MTKNALVALLLGACCAAPADPDLSASDITGSSDAAGCQKCVQTDRNACGGRPSACQCYPGPGCCCSKVRK